MTWGGQVARSDASQGTTLPSDRRTHPGDELCHANPAQVGTPVIQARPESVVTRYRRLVLPRGKTPPRVAGRWALCCSSSLVGQSVGRPCLNVVLTHRGSILGQSCTGRVGSAWRCRRTDALPQPSTPPASGGLWAWHVQGCRAPCGWPAPRSPRAPVHWRRQRSRLAEPHG